MAQGVLSAASMLFPDLSQIETLSLMPEDNPDEFQQKLEEKVRQVDTGEGVFILADILGGTPCNRAMYSVGPKVRLLAGLSLVMVLSLISMREGSKDILAIAGDVMDEVKAATLDVSKLMEEKG